MELGIYSFADLTPDPATGAVPAAGLRLREVVEEIALADEVGLDVYGLGEHHRPDYAASTPVVTLAAAGSRTSRIRLTSAVTVLSSHDPVRVFQDFATLDLLTQGRAELMVGRGSFVESFPLFGYALEDYDELFEEKLGLLLALREAERITWSGRHRPSLVDQPVYPRPEQELLPVWVAVGGNPPSVIRAATLGLPMALAIIGGSPERFRPIVELYREALRRSGRDGHAVPVSINAHGFIAKSSQEAMDQAFPSHSAMMNRIGRERGWPPMSRAEFEAQAAPRGAYFIGSPQEVAEKILWQHEIFGHERFLLQLTVGTMPHDQVMRAIELYGTEVAPIVRAELAR